jgi:membrane protein required for colicin V production
MDIAQTVDLLFLLLAAVFVLRGAFRGLSGELLSLAGFVGGIFLAWRYGLPLALKIEGTWAVSPGIAQAVAMIGIFVTVNLFSAVVERGLKAVLKFANLSLLDRLGGMLAGCLKAGVLLLGAFLAVFLLSPGGLPRWAEESRTLSLASVAWGVLAEAMEKRGWELPLPSPLSLRSEESDRRLFPASVEMDVTSPDLEVSP